jgi:D-alanyl-lipoteichoic acid acyltransferase DltB (MBOAT superfamily)
VAWGFLNGVFLVIHRHFHVWAAERAALRTVLESTPGTAGRIVLTFLTFTLGVVVFRSIDLRAAGTYLHRLFIPADGLGSPIPVITFWTMAATVFVAHVVASRIHDVRVLDRFPAPVKGFAYASVLFLALLLAPVNTKAFVYFQF